MTLRHWDDLLGGGLAQLSADTEATAGTLALRGASAEVKAARVETSTIRTTAGGAVLLQHGTTTIARISATDLPTQAGEFYIDADGQLWGWSTVWSAPSPIPSELDRPFEWDDRFAGGATSMAESVLSPPNASRPAINISSAIWVPESNLSANGTNYAQIVVAYRDSNSPGSPPVEIMTAGTSVVGWTGLTPVSVGTMFTGANEVPAGCYLTWYISGEGGAPPTVPRGRIFVTANRQDILPES